MKKQKKKSFKDILKDWDQGRFDLSEETLGELHKEVPVVSEPEDHHWVNVPVQRIVATEQRIFDRIYPVMSVLLALILIYFLFRAVSVMPPFGSAETPANDSEVILRYIEEGLAETGAVNIVAGVILDYRAFDTLGESHVLFTAVIAVFILLLRPHSEWEPARTQAILKQDLILQKTAIVLIPLIILFGCYVILNGHLGPGGGFSGGAIIGGGLILYSLAFDPVRLRRVISMNSFRIIVLVSLLFYSSAKCYSFFCGANGLHTIFRPGTPGMIFSAGLILPLNVAVGLVVSCTMYGLFSVFTRGKI